MENQMKEVCKVCGVVIEDDVVKFSHGKHGDRTKLYARVCQYTKDKSNCINNNSDGMVFKNTDFYAEFK